MRIGFREATQGWDKIEDFNQLTARIEAAAQWVKFHGGPEAMTPDEDATVRQMIIRQCELSGDPEFAKAAVEALGYPLVPPPLKPIQIEPPGQITIRPTDEVFDAGPFIVRAWKGETATGHEVVAMIALISTDGPMPTLSPIPNPYVDKSEQFRRVAGDIWKLMENLDDIEIVEMRTLIEARARYRDKGFPELICRHCHQPFRGPAVYCSFRCAVADA